MRHPHFCGHSELSIFVFNRVSYSLGTELSFENLSESLNFIPAVGSMSARQMQCDIMRYSALALDT